jgi:hypothetical protein
MLDYLIKIIIGLSVFILGLTVYAAIKEGELKDAFDQVCRDSGGVPLRATYHYDPKENKIHYVCLKYTSIMNVE